MYLHKHSIIWLLTSSTYTFDDDTAFTPSLDFDPVGLDDKLVTVKEFTLLALLVAGLVLGDPANGDLSPLFSRPLLTWLGLGEQLAEWEPMLLELELVEVEEGLLERPLWSLVGGEERLFITRPPLCLPGVQ